MPGWDCHGLPIELKAMKSSKENSEDLTSVQIRQKGKNSEESNITFNLLVSESVFSGDATLDQNTNKSSFLPSMNVRSSYI